MALTRRELLSGLAATAAVSALHHYAHAEDGASLRINAARLQQSLEGLSVFGRPAGGTFADGVSRVAYSDAYVAGRNYAMDLVRAAGLDPHIDAAGNITALRQDTGPAFKPILFGSHIDSVPSGGNFDGDLGSMASIADGTGLIEFPDPAVCQDDPSFTPDGSHVVFHRFDPATGDDAFWSMDLNGNDRHRIGPCPCGDPNVSPDGENSVSYMASQAQWHFLRQPYMEVTCSS